LKTKKKQNKIEKKEKEKQNHLNAQITESLAQKQVNLFQKIILF
jgi:hypothetical protein